MSRSEFDASNDIQARMSNRDAWEALCTMSPAPRRVSVRKSWFARLFGL